MVSENVRKTFKLCPCAWYPARKKKPERVTQMTWLKSKCKTTLFSRTIDFDQPLPRFWPKEKCPKSLLVLLGRNAKTIIFDTKCCLFLDHFHSVSFWHTQKKPCSIYLPISGPPRSSWDIMVAQAFFLQKSDKGQVFYWSSQTSTRFSRLVVTMLKKPQNCPISDFFILTPKYFLPYCLILTWNRLLLTQYHQVPNSTWPSTITYQPVPPYTDPLPPRTNQDRPILTHFHHVPTNTAPYWPSITKYQPTPPHTDPLLPQTNQHRSILTQYHQVPTSTAPYWPITTTNQPVPPNTAPVPPSTDQHRPILTHYHHKPTSTARYWPSTTKHHLSSYHPSVWLLTVNPMSSCSIILLQMGIGKA